VKSSNALEYFLKEKTTGISLRRFIVISYYHIILHIPPPVRRARLVLYYFPSRKEKKNVFNGRTVFPAGSRISPRVEFIIVEEKTRLQKFLTI